MTDKEFRQLNRAELLEMLITALKENESLKAELQQAKAELRNRRIQVEKAGSLAEAALQLNGVFQAAEAACAQYTENIRRLSEEQEQRCAQMERETQEECNRIRAEAKRKADAYLNTTAKRMQDFLASCRGPVE